MALRLNINLRSLWFIVYNRIDGDGFIYPDTDSNAKLKRLPFLYNIFSKNMFLEH